MIGKFQLIIIISMIIFCESVYSRDPYLRYRESKEIKEINLEINNFCNSSSKKYLKEKVYSRIFKNCFKKKAMLLKKLKNEQKRFNQIWVKMFQEIDFDLREYIIIEFLNCHLKKHYSSCFNHVIDKLKSNKKVNKKLLMIYKERVNNHFLRLSTYDNACMIAHKEIIIDEKNNRVKTKLHRKFCKDIQLTSIENIPYKPSKD